MRKETLPVILGMETPRYQIRIGHDKSFNGQGVDVQFVHAEFPEGTKSGSHNEPNKIIGLGAWLHFCNTETLRAVGQLLIDAAEVEDGKMG